MKINCTVQLNPQIQVYEYKWKIFTISKFLVVIVILHNKSRAICICIKKNKQHIITHKK